MKLSIKHIILIVALLSAHLAQAQNLVRNPSFEEIEDCNLSWETFPMNWSNATAMGSPDFYHACATNPNLSVPDVLGCLNLEAHTGEGYAGYYAYGDFPREFMEVQLSEPLIAGQDYYFELYASPLSDCFSLDFGFVNTLGIALTEDYFFDDEIWTLGATGIPVVNVDLTINTGFINQVGEWRKISGCIEARGGEQHLVLGNFRDNGSTPFEGAVGADNKFSYTFVDDIKLIPFDPIPDTLIICNEPLLVEGDFLGNVFKWSNGEQTTAITVNEAGPISLTYESAGCKYKDESYVFDMRSVNEFEFRDTICVGTDLELTPNVPGTYAWSTGEMTASILVNEPKNYSVTVTNECDTYVFSWETDLLDCECNSYVPNAFSPNYDGINDKLQFWVSCVGGYDLISFEVYDRWGAKVWQAARAGDTWDGTAAGQALNTGVYSWVLVYEGMEDSILATKIEKGNVLLIR